MVLQDLSAPEIHSPPSSTWLYDPGACPRGRHRRPPPFPAAGWVKPGGEHCQMLEGERTVRLGCLFVCLFFGRAAGLVGSYFPDQGSSPRHWQ